VSSVYLAREHILPGVGSQAIESAPLKGGLRPAKQLASMGGVDRIPTIL
jgi:hypothetical protein